MSCIRHPLRSESARIIPSHAVVRFAKELTRIAYRLLACRKLRTILMVKPRTHFEQVPLEIVKKIAEEGMSPETVTEGHPGTSKNKMEKDLRMTQKQSKANSRRASQLELSE